MDNILNWFSYLLFFPRKKSSKRNPLRNQTRVMNPNSLRAVFSVPTTDRKKMPAIHHLPKSHTPMISRANAHRNTKRTFYISNKTNTIRFIKRGYSVDRIHLRRMTVPILSRFIPTFLSESRCDAFGKRKVAKVIRNYFLFPFRVSMFFNRDEKSNK